MILFPSRVCREEGTRCPSALDLLITPMCTEYDIFWDVEQTYISYIKA
jgi:hypothetical protein